MSANIFRLPVVRKRGRKVTKGAKASVTVIYEIDESASTAPGKECDKLEELLFRSALRWRRQILAMKADPKIIFFPENRRVNRDDEKAMGKEESALTLEMKEIGDRVSRRVDALIALEVADKQDLRNQK